MLHCMPAYSQQQQADTKAMLQSKENHRVRTYLPIDNMVPPLFLF